MDEVVGDIAPGEGAGEGCPILDIARHDLDPRSRAMLKRLGSSGEASHVVAGGLESRQEPATDVPGGASQNNSVGRAPACSRTRLRHVRSPTPRAS